MAGVPKGYKQAETHRLRARITRRERMLRRLDQDYAARHKQLTDELNECRAALLRAEVLEKAAKAEAAVAS